MGSCISEEISTDTAGCEDASRLAGCCLFLSGEGSTFWVEHLDSTYFLLICFWRGIFSLKNLNVRRLGNDILKNCRNHFHFRTCVSDSVLVILEMLRLFLCVLYNSALYTSDPRFLSLLITISIKSSLFHFSPFPLFKEGESISIKK